LEKLKQTQQKQTYIINKNVLQHKINTQKNEDSFGCLLRPAAWK